MNAKQELERIEALLAEALDIAERLETPRAAMTCYLIGMAMDEVRLQREPMPTNVLPFRKERS